MTKTKLIALFSATILFVFCLFGCKNPEKIKPGSDENLPEIIIGSDEYRPFFYSDEKGTFQSIDGVSLNLGFDKLYEASKVLTDALRKKQTEGIGKLYEKVKNEYERVLKAIDACS